MQLWNPIPNLKPHFQTISSERRTYVIGWSWSSCWPMASGRSRRLWFLAWKTFVVYCRHRICVFYTHNFHQASDWFQYTSCAVQYALICTVWLHDDDDDKYLLGWRVFCWPLHALCCLKKLKLQIESVDLELFNWVKLLDLNWKAAFLFETRFQLSKTI